MVTILPVATAFVAMVNVAVVAPAATVTDAGTVAALVSLLVSVIRAPPAGAADVSVTVAVLLAPAVRLAGFRATELKEAGGAASLTTKPSLPPALCACTGATTGKLVDAV